MNEEILCFIIDIKRKKKDETQKNASNVFNETEVKQLLSDAPTSSKDIAKVCTECEIETESKK